MGTMDQTKANAHIVKSKRYPNGIHDSQARYGRPFICVEGPSAILPNAKIVLMGMHEDYAGDAARTQAHYGLFHKCIDQGYWVRLIHDGPEKGVLFDDLKSLDAYINKNGLTDDGGGRRDRRVTIVNLVQFLNPDYFDWTDAERGWVRAHSLVGILFVVWRRLTVAGFVLTDLHGIIHDKDEREVWSPAGPSNISTEGSYVIEPKDAHVHILGKVKGHGATIEQFADVLGVAPEFLVCPEKGRYAWDNALAYLPHAKDDNKHQYDASEVVTLVGTDFRDIYCRRRKDWAKGAALKRKNRVSHDLEWLLNLIRDGKVTRKNIQLSDEMYRIYSAHVDACDKAFKAATQRKNFLEARALNNGEFSKTVSFIDGDAGSGKTCLAKAFLGTLCEIMGWTMAQATDGHITETLSGEECVLLDDVDAFEIGGPGKAKRLLDNHNASPVDERFKAQTYGPVPRVMAITSTKEPREYFVGLSRSFGEQLSQFLRRITVEVRVGSAADFGYFQVTLFTPRECKAADYSYQRYNRHTGEYEDTIVKGIMVALTPVTDAGGNRLSFSFVGAVVWLVRLVDFLNGHPLAGVSDQTIREAAIRHVHEAFDASPIALPANLDALPDAMCYAQTPVGLRQAAESAARLKAIEDRNQRIADELAAREREKAAKAALPQPTTEEVLARHERELAEGRERKRVSDERDHASALRALARVMPKWYATTDDDTRRRFLDCRTGDALAYAVEVGLAGYVADTRRLSARGPGFEFEDDFDELDDARTSYARCLTREEVLAAYRAVAPDTGNAGVADAADACDTDTDNERRNGS